MNSYENDRCSFGEIDAGVEPDLLYTPNQNKQKDIASNLYKSPVLSYFLHLQIFAKAPFTPNKNLSKSLVYK